ncbi:MAG: QueT transporter family protein [Ruminococcaceae bacterium]|nr:QueT transporter family protein [Oscillospiraceae bacterium]
MTTITSCWFYAIGGHVWERGVRPMRRSVYFIASAALIAAAYVVLTFPMAQLAYGPLQFRLAEALSVMAALTPAAIPGLFLGCLTANLINPVNLGPIDIIGGSLATLAAAWLTWRLRCRFITGRLFSYNAPLEGGKAVRRWKKIFRQMLVISPSVLINALVVGFYLPYLIPGMTINALVIISTMLSIFISQAVVVYLIGLPLLLALVKARPDMEGHYR